MILALNVISLGFIVLTSIWLYRISYSFIQLKRQRQHTDNSVGVSSIKIVNILLPVLNEDTRLNDFVKYFLKDILPVFPNLRLNIITNERENKEYPNSKTFKIAKQVSSANASIKHVHYPFENGAMAHQLNYATNSIPDNQIVAVFNADSRPEINTFKWVLDHAVDGDKQIFQQYGIYTKNIAYLKKQPFSRTLIANAYWQCRWTFGFEYYRSQSTIHKKRWPRILKPFNYCIGHGLFITSDLVRAIKFSEDTTNEDAIFGIQATLNDVPPIPIPYFDLSESPDSIKSIYLQKTNWFQGPFQAPLYYKKLSKTTTNRLYLLLLCAKLFSHAIYWTVGPIMALLLIIISIYVSMVESPAYLLFSLSLLTFLVFPALLTKVFISLLKIPQQNISNSKLASSLILGAIPAYLLHGGAGSRGIVLSKRILHSKKQKTIMSQYGEA